MSILSIGVHCSTPTDALWLRRAPNRCSSSICRSVCANLSPVSPGVSDVEDVAETNIVMQQYLCTPSAKCRTFWIRHRQPHKKDLRLKPPRDNCDESSRSSCAAAAIMAAIAQLAARRSHNPKVVSSILTCRIFLANCCSRFRIGTRCQAALCHS